MDRCRRAQHGQSRQVLLVALLGVALQQSAGLAGRMEAIANPSLPATSALRPQLAPLPLSFEINRGQTDPRVKALARAPGYNVFLTPIEAVLALSPARERHTPPADRHDWGLPRRARDLVGSPELPSRLNLPGRIPRDPRLDRARQAQAGPTLRISLLGANVDASLSGEEALPGRANYFVGGDRDRWQTGVATYARVRYWEVYPGIDLVFYGTDRRLEYDFIVSAGADPGSIRLAVEGADNVSLDQNGDLVLRISDEELRQHRPIIYQEIAGRRQPVDGGYVLHAGPGEQTAGAAEVTFQIGPYDSTRPLIIDPIIDYGSYVGGSGVDDLRAVKVDPAGNIYLTGSTQSLDFPLGATPADPTFGASEAFVMKLDPTGTTLLYSTYLGGMNADFSNTLAVDAAGSAFVAGETLSVDFPTTGGAFQELANIVGESSDGFVTKLDGYGALVYSTYLGGMLVDSIARLALDAAGNAYVTGTTLSQDFPVTLGAFDQTPGAIFSSEEIPRTDAFVTKLDPTGSSLVYSTYLSTDEFEDGLGIAVDAAGNAYVTGDLGSIGQQDLTFPTTPGAFRTDALVPPVNQSADDAFLLKLNSGGSGLVYSTYLNMEGWPLAVALDAAGNAYVTGVLFSSSGFTTTPGAFDTSPSGINDAFVMKLDPSGSTLVYSTFLGGDQFEFAFDILVDPVGNAHVVGVTGQFFTPIDPFPTTPLAPDTTLDGPSDAFVAALDPNGSSLVYSTFLGGAADDGAAGIGLGPDGGIHVVGTTTSADFPTTLGAFDATASGDLDGFLVILRSPIPPPELMVPITKDQCKKGGWQHLTDHTGTPFRNQGDCVSYVATGGKNLAGGGNGKRKGKKD